MRERILKVSIYLLFLLLLPNKEITYASQSSHLFNDILSVTKSQVVEYGLKVSVEAEENGKKQCSDILRKLEIDNTKYTINLIESEQSYYVEFKSEEVTGYVEYISEDNNRKVNMEIIKSGHSFELEELEHNLKKAVSGNNEIQLYRYVKARMDMTDTNEAKKLVVRTLEEVGATNISDINLGNSYSITALTGAYERIKSGGTWIDFNSAICSYDSGNYLIIGTPVIMKSY